MALAKITIGVRVQPGDANKGIFIRLTSGPGAGGSYRITHPVANVNGVLRGSPYATICESVGVLFFVYLDNLTSCILSLDNHHLGLPWHETIPSCYNRL